jgi:hypothetical protein
MNSQDKQKMYHREQKFMIDGKKIEIYNVWFQKVNGELVITDFDIVVNDLKYMVTKKYFESKEKVEIFE